MYCSDRSSNPSQKVLRKLQVFAFSPRLGFSFSNNLRMKYVPTRIRPAVTNENAPGTRIFISTAGRGSPFFASEKHAPPFGYRTLWISINNKIYNGKKELGSRPCSFLSFIVYRHTLRRHTSFRKRHTKPIRLFTLTGCGV